MESCRQSPIAANTCRQWIIAKRLCLVPSICDTVVGKRVWGCGKGVRKPQTVMVNAVKNAATHVNYSNCNTFSLVAQSGKNLYPENGCITWIYLHFVLLKRRISNSFLDANLDLMERSKKRFVFLKALQLSVAFIYLHVYVTLFYSFLRGR